MTHTIFTESYISTTVKQAISISTVSNTFDIGSLTFANALCCQISVTRNINVIHNIYWFTHGQSSLCPPEDSALASKIWRKIINRIVKLKEIYSASFWMTTAGSLLINVSLEAWYIKLSSHGYLVPAWFFTWMNPIKSSELLLTNPYFVSGR